MRAWAFSPRRLPWGDRARARGDSDREIVGIRGVTRGDLVLAHNGSICLRSSDRREPPATCKISPAFPTRPVLAHENFPVVILPARIAKVAKIINVARTFPIEANANDKPPIQ